MSETEAPTDEISLLDIAVVIAENWLMLVIAPLLIGVLAYIGMALAVPRTYQSEALLRIDATEAALLRSAQVLDTAMLGSDYLAGYAGSLSRARAQVIENIALSPEPNTELYRVRVTLDSPEGAQRLLERIIDALIAKSVPTGARKAQLELQLQQVQTAIAELEATLTRLNRTAEGLGNGTAASATALGEFGNSVVSVVSEIERRRLQVFQLEQALTGTVSPEAIVQPPTLPDNDGSRGLAMRTLLIVAATGFVLLIIAFIRSGLRNASEDPRQIDKINRIRRAFWLRPKSLPTS